MTDREELRRRLLRLDGGPYPAYRDIKGSYELAGFTLHVDHVQGDPYAEPSRVRVRVALGQAGFSRDLWAHPSRRVGVCSFLADRFASEAGRLSSGRGTGKSGLVTIDAPGQEVLESTAVLLSGDALEARFRVGLPARGRRILGRAAAELLCDDLPEITARSLFFASLDPEEVRRHADVNEDADFLRSKLPELGLAAFVADGAILPRRSGVDPCPMPRGAVAFRSPPGLRVEVDLPRAGRVSGMGIPRGVTLVVGGGFHGKSTLLEALELGVYNHRPGDGRELAVTDACAVKVRSEDGRSVAAVDISPFIGELPLGVDTRTFSTQDASGSTSQAANILEALEAGARVLLIDEDTSASNFMIRDHRMQELVSKDKEPITPFVDNVRRIWEELEVSTILVMGGSGDYFDAADTVIAMEEYVPRDATVEAKAVAERCPTYRLSEGGERFGAPKARRPLGRSLDPSRGRREESVKSRGVKTVLFGTAEIDLSAVEQLVRPGQLRSIGAALLRVRALADGRRDVPSILDAVEAEVAAGGLDALTGRPLGELAAFRRFELAAALNRLRTLEIAPG
ncbi:MAG: ABC-ATPase domain-containing protein [Deferrisomatales bacterium]|nr:ABC-ATPase domain-containing protein [Deferrisomatales bacterium]